MNRSSRLLFVFFLTLLVGIESPAYLDVKNKKNAQTVSSHRNGEIEQDFRLAFQEYFEKNFVYLPGGTFLMKGKQVTVSPFWVLKSHMTRKDWRRFMGADPKFYDCGFTIQAWNRYPKMPVTCISAEEIDKRLVTLNEKLNGDEEVAVISEEQAEYLQRLWIDESRVVFISQTEYPWGDNPDDDLLRRYAVYRGAGGLRNVMMREPIAGIYDARGLVYTWTSTTDVSSQRIRRVIRGGSYMNKPGFLRSSFRAFAEPWTRFYDRSVRLVIVP